MSAGSGGRVCAYTSVCEEDACWIPQYLVEVERLDMPFAIHLDRCSKDTLAMVATHPLCIGYTSQQIMQAEFNEMHKQRVFNLVVHAKYEWAMAWDIDETYERNAKEKIEEIVNIKAPLVSVRWLNLWGDAQHIRVDGPFASGHRVKFICLRDYTWRFMHKVINGPKAFDRRGRPVPTSHICPANYDLVTLHWGLMTRELRESHKRRWDRIYTKAIGRQPYGFWDYAVDEVKYPPVTVPNEYL